MPSVCAGGKASNCCLNRRQLALFPLFVYNDRSARIQLQLVADCFRARAQDDSCEADSRVPRDFDQVFEEGRAAVGKQGFGSAHPPGFTGGENRGGEHPGLVVVQGRELRRALRICARDSALALRRTAINSAVMLTAISSGVSAPISMPTGAWTFSNFSGAYPSFSSAL